ncbi:MAG: sugar phosphate isomerase/epimerase [Lachnospiraceae bacterium]|nr:sugar phosphate isomerase/epimerase [Lachnospiraceae bacterium]
MKKMKASFIGIMPYDLQGDAKWAAIKELGKIGFKGSENVEGWVRGEDGKVDPELLKKVKSYGIEPVDVAAFNGENLKRVGADSIIERAHALGVDKAVMFHGAAYYAKGGKVVTYDEVMKEIEMLQEVSAKCKKEGVKFSYHNHDHEFTISFKGLSVYDMLLAYAPDLYMELDCGWATYAGMDAPALIRKLGAGDRLALMHFKDFLPGGPVKATVPMLEKGKKYNMPNFCAVGAGALPVYECLKACQEVGIEFITCEQDFPHTLKGIDILRMDYAVLKESGMIL